MRRCPEEAAGALLHGRKLRYRVEEDIVVGNSFFLFLLQSDFFLSVMERAGGNLCVARKVSLRTKMQARLLGTLAGIVWVCVHCARQVGAIEAREQRKKWEKGELHSVCPGLLPEWRDGMHYLFLSCLS